MEELKKCPFCGGNAEIVKIDIKAEYPNAKTEDDSPLRYHFYAHCPSCGASATEFASEASAAEAWNWRTEGQDDDWEKYSDKLWKNAYERGKADRPQGEWIVNMLNYESVCSVCGASETDFIYGTEMWYGLGESKFCPSCGARMKGADDE